MASDDLHAETARLRPASLHIWPVGLLQQGCAAEKLEALVPEVTDCGHLGQEDAVDR